ncbi:hypothetical protein GCM10009779_64360 [Polymorphospora rubra]|uniref:Helix-turn-helix domain-containing protein n=1 Tax=Polymorphospora rubra TaxID=338584 RepID=A0A810MYT9_9ACTN|nr:hypothetical protein Prubr_21500 [Polymorphospora rubra]
MSTRVPGQGRLVAPVSGPVAVILARLLDEHLPRRLLSLETLVERGRMTPDLLKETLQMWADVRLAAYAYESGPAVAAVTAEPVTAVASGLMLSEITTEAAAELLNVSPNRVRQLLRRRDLQGRKIGRTWVVDLADARRQRDQRDQGWRETDGIEPVVDRTDGGRSSRHPATPRVRRRSEGTHREPSGN